ncbi:MAG: hypothetical protein ACLGH6_07165, partial [Gammaproteobacteria bacterium]
MSLVNQMLKDLEARRAQLPQGDSLRGLHAAPSGAVPSRSRWPLVMLLAGAGGGAFGWWLSQPGDPALSLPIPMAMAESDARDAAAAVPAAPASDTHATAAAPATDIPAPTDIPAAAVTLAALETPAQAAPPRPALEPTPAEPTPVIKPAPRRPPATALARAEDTGERPGVMHKTARPLDPQQRAAQHYTEALQSLRGGATADAETALRAALEIQPG